MEEVKIIQKKILELLKVFINICEQNNLTYYALGGTLLGAVRHEGFIPWDDDIDLGMPREDYEKLKKIASKELNGRYLFLSEDSLGYRKAFSVIRDTSTKIIMNYSNVEQEESLWIDIFPIDGLPGNKVDKFIQEKKYLYRRMMVQLSQFDTIVNQNKPNRPYYEKIIINVAKILKIEKLLSFEKEQKKYLNTIKKYSLKEAYAGNYTGAYKLREIVPTNYFGKPQKLKFEGIDLCVPYKFREYLCAIYGENYMELPPVEQRVPHQYKIINLGEES
jgi:putative licD-family phosphotransferase